jgi:exopolysaccharide production protein ExoZ
MPTIIAIQALRAFAVLAVLSRHSWTPHFGAAGVDIFFVISGFVMVYVSTDQFGRPGAPGNFVLRRVVRIVPLYWACTLVTLALASTHPSFTPPPDYAVIWKLHLSPDAVLQSLLFIPDAEAPPTLGIGWSLNFEMFFYAAFAAVLLLPRRIGVVLVSALLLLLVAFGRAFLVHSPLVWWDPITIEFVFGMIIGLLYVEGWKFGKSVGAGFLLFGFGALLFWAAYGIEYNMQPLRFVYWGVPAAFIVAGATLPRWQWSGFSARFVAFLGDASYAIYLSHIAMFMVLNLFGLSTRAIYFASGLAVGVLVHVFIEKPVTRALKSRLRRSGASRDRAQVQIGIELVGPRAADKQMTPFDGRGDGAQPAL